jgi:UDP-N-acetylmuramate dehydrogenase
MDAVSIDAGRVTAGAGVVLDQLVRQLVGSGLEGLEKLSGIPGSIGGAVWMNAGAYGAEISDCITKVTVIAAGRLMTLSKEDCRFNYRSAAALKELIVVEAEWLLTEGDSSSLLAIRKDILARRTEKQPLDFPSCGSVFKRPEGDYASRLIDAAGLKGFQIGGAQVSEKHAGFIINRGGATAADVFAVIAHCQNVVKAKFGVALELEQQVLRAD